MLHSLEKEGLDKKKLILTINNLKDSNTSMKFYVDKNLERFVNVFAAAGHPNCIFEIEFHQLIKLTNGLMKEIAE